jgi:hypothetical protein
VSLAPRDPGESVGPGRVCGVVVRPVNFTVRRRTRMHFAFTLSVTAASAIAVSAGVNAGELTEGQAISVAKAATARECGQPSPCTFRARREVNRWYVRVEFTKRNSLEGPPVAYPGGHEILVVDDHGKIVDTLPGE